MRTPLVLEVLTTTRAALRSEAIVTRPSTLRCEVETYAGGTTGPTATPGTLEFSNPANSGLIVLLIGH